MTDLKIKDVAELLNISETTVRRWLADRKIPAYRINRQYRFSRTEIEDWVMNQRLGGNDCLSPYSATTHVEEPADSLETPRTKSTSGTQQFSLYRAMNNGRVLSNIPGTTKNEVFHNTTKTLASSLDLDPEVLSELLIDREKLMPTGLNNGIGVPHARDFLLNSHRDVVVTVFPENPITDYGSLDGKPVHTLFFLFATEDKIHLHLLAKIAHFVAENSVRRILASKPTNKQLLETARNWESSL